MNRELLNELLTVVFTPLETRGITDRLLKYVTGEDVGNYLGITGGRIWERREDSYKIVSQVGSNGNKDSVLPADHHYLRLIQENGYILYRRGDDGRDHSLEDVHGVGDFIAVPIGPDAKYLAAFDIIDDRKKTRIQKSFLGMVSTISQTALQEAERLREIEHQRGEMQNELSHAYDMQTTILPTEIPEFEGYDIYAVSKPLKNPSVGGVGGDYYSISKMEEDLMELSIGDVAGKGLIAAEVASNLHIAKITAKRFNPSIDELLKQLNNVLCESIDLLKLGVNIPGESGRFMTYFYGQLQKDGRFNYVRAGHDRPILLRGDDITELPGGELPLGIIEDVKYTINVTNIDAGDVLTLYTDGIIDTVSREAERFGTDRLKEVIHRSKGASAKETVGNILEAVKKHRNGAHKVDDRTLVVLKCAE